MRYWVFHEAMLDEALAAHEAALRREGASEQQAQDEAVAIKLFLLADLKLQGHQVQDWQHGKRASG